MTPKTSKTQIKLFSEMQEENKRLSRKDRTLQRDEKLRKDFYELYSEHLKETLPKNAHKRYKEALTWDYTMAQIALQYNLSVLQTNRIVNGYIRKAA